MRLYPVLIKVFAALLLFLGLISVINGIYMIPTNGMGMPLSWLENTVFGSYLVPGLILANCHRRFQLFCRHLAAA